VESPLTTFGSGPEINPGFASAITPDQSYAPLDIAPSGHPLIISLVPLAIIHASTPCAEHLFIVTSPISPLRSAVLSSLVPSLVSVLIVDVPISKEKW